MEVEDEARGSECSVTIYKDWSCGGTSWSYSRSTVTPTTEDSVMGSGGLYFSCSAGQIACDYYRSEFIQTSWGNDWSYSYRISGDNCEQVIFLDDDTHPDNKATSSFGGGCFNFAYDLESDVKGVTIIMKKPTSSPTRYPTQYPTTRYPTRYPTQYPTTRYPTQSPTRYPTQYPTPAPTSSPTSSPTDPPTHAHGTCLSWCEHKNDQMDWDTKCGLNACNGCNLCGDREGAHKEGTGIGANDGGCAPWCEDDSRPWSTKCGFRKACAACNACS